MSDGGIFRAQALKPIRPSWIGGVTVTSDRMWWAYLAICVLIAIAFILLIAFGSYTRRVVVGGALVPSSGVAIITATISGAVTDIDYEISDIVERGDRLASISASSYSPDLGDTALAVADNLGRRVLLARSGSNARLSISKLKQHAAQARIISLEAELRNIAAEIGEREKQVESSRAVAERYRQISVEGYVSFVQLQAQESQVLEARNSLRAAQRQEISLRRELADQIDVVEELVEGEKSIEAELESELALIDMERVRNLTSSGNELRAPFDGYIGNIYLKPGQPVEAGEPVISVVGSNSPLHGEIYLSSAEVAFVKRGDRVVVSYDSFPYRRFGHQLGKISSISDVAVIDGNIKGGVPVYKAYFDIDSQTVLTYSSQEPLRPGMTFTAHIQGERKSLYEWLLEPLYSIGMP